jgi:hypothetical protein
MRLEVGKVTETPGKKKIAFEGRAWVNLGRGCIKMDVKIAYHSALEI